MPIEQVVREGWFSRLRKSLGGILFGLLFVAAAATLQFWNEGRTLRQAQLLDAGRKEVVSVPASLPLESAAAQLVHVSGPMKAEGERLDPVFNQVAEGIALRRKVEMYQWRERKESKEETSVGGSKTTRTTYHYDQVWDDEPIDHRQFEQPAGHENPGAFPFSDETWRAERVQLGELELAPEVIEEVGGWKPMAPALEQMPENLAASFRQDGERLVTQSGNDPAIGDLRVSFERVPEGDLSVVARREGNRLSADVREQGSLLLVERGLRSADELFNAAESRNAGLGWMLRLGGFALMWLGLAMVFAPLAILADVLPFLGRMTRFVNGLVSGLIAAGISFFAIAAGWLYHRPWLLVLVAAALVAGVVWLLRRGRGAAVAAVAAPPPPPPPPIH